MRDSSEIAWMVHRAMVSAGLDINTIYQRLGYDLRDLPLNECRPDNDLQHGFWRAIEAVSGNPDIGLFLCPHLPLFRGGGLDYLLIASNTLESGLHMVFRYPRLISDALSISLVNDDNASAHIALTGAVDNKPMVRHSEMLYVYQCLKVLHAATDGEFAATRVRLCCPALSPVAEYESVFSCPVEFEGDVNEIHFQPSMLAWQSPHADADLLELHHGHLQRRMQTVAHHDCMDELYEYLLAQLEATSGPGDENETSYSLAEAAYALGLSNRRLRFELAAAGTCYRDLLARAKIAHAKELLANGQTRIRDIADNAGFSKQQAFVRAFRRATGITPSAYRAQHRALS